MPDQPTQRVLPPCLPVEHDDADEGSRLMLGLCWQPYGLLGGADGWRERSWTDPGPAPPMERAPSLLGLARRRKRPKRRKPHEPPVAQLEAQAMVAAQFALFEVPTVDPAVRERLLSQVASAWCLKGERPTPADVIAGRYELPGMRSFAVAGVSFREVCNQVAAEWKGVFE